MPFEESRHKHVLANMVRAYGITLAPEPDYTKPRDPEWAFLVTGYSECIDSFFAFGLFEIARRSGFFPPELAENDRRLVIYDARLLRPRAVPTLVRLARRFMGEADRFSRA